MDNFLQFMQQSISLSTLNSTTFSTTASTSFLLISIAEIGDKSQLVCMTLAAKYKPVLVLPGRTLLQRCPLTLLHRISGSMFLILAALAGYNSYYQYI